MVDKTVMHEKQCVNPLLDNYLSKDGAIAIRKKNKDKSSITSFFRIFEIFVFCSFIHSRRKESEEVKIK
jgi:hypothetical protein